jgi:formate dehydrogenase maturation protein FdhE
MAAKQSNKYSDLSQPVLARLDSALDGLEGLKNREGVSWEYLDFHMTLTRFRKQAVRRLAGEPAVMGETSAKGAFLLTLEDFKLFSESGVFPEHFADTVHTLHDADAGLIDDWIAAIQPPSPQVLSGVAARLSLEAEVLQFLGRELLKPSYHLTAANRFTDDMRDKWNQGRCPICNGFPQFAKLEQDTGARWLWCDLCDIQWKFDRMTCPFCGHREVEKARYFTIAGEEANGSVADPMRVTVCDKCHSYIKTYDERVGEQPLDQPLVEDVGSLTLDLVASREGYVHPNIGSSFS